MTKIDVKTNKAAFSLAEALMTLLIVCLVTLASVPILTKKSRNISEGVHGSYICTAESVIEEDPATKKLIRKKVIYKQKSTTDGNDWKEVNKCEFTVPQNSNIIVATVIGGGGGGGQATSRENVIINANGGDSNANFQVSTEGYYNFKMSSAGGGAASASTIGTASKSSGFGANGAVILEW